jgi:hypothetical protein
MGRWRGIGSGLRMCTVCGEGGTRDQKRQTFTELDRVLPSASFLWNALEELTSWPYTEDGRVDEGHP